MRTRLASFYGRILTLIRSIPNSAVGLKRSFRPLYRKQHRRLPVWSAEPVFWETAGIIATTWAYTVEQGKRLFSFGKAVVQWIGPGKLAAAIITGWVLIQALRPVVLIEHFEMDPEIKQHFPSEAAFSMEIEKQISHIYENVSIRYKTETLAGGPGRPEVRGDSEARYALPTTESSSDFHVPAVGVSYTTLLNFIRHLIGNDPASVTGMIDFNNPTLSLDDSDTSNDFRKRKVHVGITITRPGQSPLEDWLFDKSLEDFSGLAHDVAERVVESTDSLAYGAYLCHQDPTKGLKVLKSLPSPTGWAALAASLPWTRERKRQAFLHGYLGDTLTIIEEDPTRAKEEFKLSFRLNPQATIANNLGAAFYREKKYTDAIEWYQRALQLTKKNRIARAYTLCNLGLAEGALNHTKEAVNAFIGSIEADPHDDQNPGAYASLGFLLLEKAKYVEAERYLRLYVELAPYDGYGVINLSRALAGQERVSEAINILRKAVDTQAENENVDNELGILLKQGHHPDEEAIAAYRRAIEKYPYSSHTKFACLNLANLLNDAGRRGEAVQVLEDRQKTTSGETDVQQLLEEMKLHPKG